MIPFKITQLQDLESAFSIRRTVFVEEQGVPLNDEFDAFDTLDGPCDHILVTYEGKPVGTGRICIQDGFGKELIKALEEIEQLMDCNK